jgi:hypothetical protein
MLRGDTVGFVETVRDHLHSKTPLGNTLTTSRWFSLQHLMRVESIVHIAIGETTAITASDSQWLQADADVIRRRIHEDMHTFLQSK